MVFVVDDLPPDELARVLEASRRERLGCVVLDWRGSAQATIDALRARRVGEGPIVASGERGARARLLRQPALPGHRARRVGFWRSPGR